MLEKKVSFKLDGRLAESMSTRSSSSSSSSLQSASNRSLLNRLRETGHFVRVVQAFVVILFVVALIGALFYAIREGEVPDQPPPFHWVAGDIYSPLFSQFSSQGKGTIVTVKRAENNAEKEILHEFSTAWYQNDADREIVHRLDQNTVAFVYQNDTFFADVKNCFVWKGHGYLDYLISEGLYEMDDRHPVRTLDGQSVFVFDANPALVRPNPTRNPQFTWGDALLTQAFVHKTQGTLKAWQTHYTVPLVEAMEPNKEYVRRVEYWMPQMRRTRTRQEQQRPAELDGMPPNCKQQQQQG